MELRVSPSKFGTQNCFVALPHFVVNSIFDQLESISSHSSFVALEVHWIQSSLNEGKEVHLPRRAFFAWSGETSSSAEFLELSPHFATCMQLTPQQQVLVKPYLDVVKAITITVEPLTADDWEILELHAEYLEDHILNQVGVVFEGQILPICIRNQIVVKIKVNSTEPPAPCCQLVNDSEIIIAPKERGRKKDHSSTISLPKNSMGGDSKGLKSRQLRIEINEKRNNSENLYRCARVHPNTWIAFNWKSYSDLFLELEIEPLRKAEEKSADGVVKKKKIILRAFPSVNAAMGHIQIDRRDLEWEGIDLDELNLKRIKVTPILHLETKRSEYFTICPIRDYQYEEFQPESIFAAVVHWATKNNSLGNHHVPFRSGSVVNLSTERRHSSKQESPFVIFIGKENESNRSGSLESFLPTEDENYSLLNLAEVKYSSFSIGPKVMKEKSQKLDKDSVLDLEKIGGIEKQKKESLSWLKSVFHQNNAELRKEIGLKSGGGLFLCGPHGSGKSFLASSLLKSLRNDKNCLIFSRIFDCSKWVEKKLENVKSNLLRLFSEADKNRPSIVLLEDLDMLVPASEGNEDLRSGQMSHFLVETLNRVQNGSKGNLTVIATCQSSTSFHDFLRTGHFVSKFIEFNAPNQSERSQLLSHILKWKKESGIISPSTEEESIAKKVSETTEGYLGSDLEQLFERARTVSSSRRLEESKGLNLQFEDVEDGVSLTLDDFLEAQKNYIPISLKGIELHKSDVEWDDIGGLYDVKRTLKETLQWPAKYPKLYQNIPLRPRSGLLLFGAPGTGKTLLASAVAKECGLNFISIKGPELLNKYIGASEQSVRDLFRRASQAKPCILFFDEFDSIAPRRGHDSTGVTDRVVNQLLTQLDGVEGLQGVYVLAATSRPDMIDPALLRPGRLDKSLHCDFPSKEERIDILKSVSRKMNLSNEVSLEEVAELSNHFTGADLQALMYSSQLEVIHEAIATPSQKGPKEASANNVVVFNLSKKNETKNEETLSIIDRIDSMTSKVINSESSSSKNGTSQKRVNLIETKHIKQAFSSSRPSISEKERRRFQSLYAEFLSSRDNISEHHVPTGKRTTLA